MFGTCTFARFAIFHFCEEAFNIMLCTSLLFRVKWPAFATVPAKKSALQKICCILIQPIMTGQLNKHITALALVL